MITSDLFNEVLVKPAKEGANNLYIVSGFASASMVASQFERLKELTQYPEIILIIGMFPKISSLEANHLAFKRLSSEDYPNVFQCRYLIKPPPVHVKAYGWFKGINPYRGFLGSANYTGNGFGNSIREAMTLCKADAVKAYFDTLLPESVDCRDDKADQLVQQELKRLETTKQKIEAAVLTTPSEEEKYIGLDHVSINFLDRNSELPKISGLNWGQRGKRNRNEAYIRVPSSIAKSDFFPPKKVPFTVLTDDDKSLICSRAQEDIAKAIHSPLNNSEIGLYFRNRLGLASGAFITKQNLVSYGRTNVDFYKIDDETYLMDFSVPSQV